MNSTQGQRWSLCGMYVIIKHNTVVLNTYPFVNQEHLPFTVLILFTILISPRIFSYSSFRILCRLTIDGIYSLHLVSLL